MTCQPFSCILTNNVGERTKSTSGRGVNHHSVYRSRPTEHILTYNCNECLISKNNKGQSWKPVYTEHWKARGRDLAPIDAWNGTQVCTHTSGLWAQGPHAAYAKEVALHRSLHLMGSLLSRSPPRCFIPTDSLVKAWCKWLGPVTFIFKFDSTAYPSLKHSKLHCSSDGTQKFTRTNSHTYTKRKETCSCPS